MWKYFTDLFDYLPLTALVEGQVWWFSQPLPTACELFQWNAILANKILHLSNLMHAVWLSSCGRGMWDVGPQTMPISQQGYSSRYFLPSVCPVVSYQWVSVNLVYFFAILPGILLPFHITRLSGCIFTSLQSIPPTFNLILMNVAVVIKYHVGLNDGQDSMPITQPSYSAVLAFIDGTA